MLFAAYYMMVLAWSPLFFMGLSGTSVATNREHAPVQYETDGNVLYVFCAKP